jgi:hypothetical protein
MSCTLSFLVFTVFCATPPSLKVNYCYSYSTLQYYTSWSSSSAGCLVFLGWVDHIYASWDKGGLPGWNRTRACWRASHWATPHPIFISHQDRVYRMSRRVIHAAIPCRTGKSREIDIFETSIELNMYFLFVFLIAFNMFFWVLLWHYLIVTYNILYIK